MRRLERKEGRKEILKIRGYSKLSLAGKNKKGMERQVRARTRDLLWQ